MTTSPIAESEGRHLRSTGGVGFEKHVSLCFPTDMPLQHASQQVPSQVRVYQSAFCKRLDMETERTGRQARHTSSEMVLVEQISRSMRASTSMKLSGCFSAPPEAKHRCCETPCIPAFR